MTKDEFIKRLIEQDEDDFSDAEAGQKTHYLVSIRDYVDEKTIDELGLDLSAAGMGSSEYSVYSGLSEEELILKIARSLVSVYLFPASEEMYS